MPGLVARQVYDSEALRGEAADYLRVVLTRDHVVMERKNGLVELLRREDALTQIRAGHKVSARPIEVGSTAHMRAITVEPGPASIAPLYRGMLSSSDAKARWAPTMGIASLLGTP